MGLNVKRLLPIVSEMKDLLQRFPRHTHTIIGTILVWTGARKAFHPEDVVQGNKEAIQVLQTVMRWMNATSFRPKIKYQEFDFPLVYRDQALDKFSELTDRERAKWLGFSCIGHTFGNANIDRIGIDIETTTQVGLHNEYCVASTKNVTRQMHKLQRFCMKKTQQFNRVLNLFGLHATYKLRFNPGNVTKNANLDNDRYVREQFDNYVDDIGNYWTDKTMFLDKTWDDVKRNDLTQLFRFAHWIGTSVKVFQDVLYMSEELEKQEKQLGQFEHELSQNKVLAATPYKQWVGTREFRDILKRQPKFIREGFALSFS